MLAGILFQLYSRGKQQHRYMIKLSRQRTSQDQKISVNAFNTIADCSIFTGIYNFFKNSKNCYLKKMYIQ